MIKEERDKVVKELHTIVSQSKEQLIVEKSQADAVEISLEEAKDSLKVRAAQLQESEAEVVHLQD